MKLSETIRHWFEKIGIHSDYHRLRSNVHLVVYFVLGVVLSLYGRDDGWKWRVIVFMGCGFKLLDEGIKILLPTWEFDVIDLVKDWIGRSLPLELYELCKKHGKGCCIWEFRECV